jgi:hypothetical protein
MLDLDAIIEYSDKNSPEEFKVFVEQVESIPHDVLAELARRLNDYPHPETETGRRRSFLEQAVSEVTWHKFFDTYKDITGERFELDSR